MVCLKGSTFPVLDVHPDDRNQLFLIGHGGKSKTANPGVIYDLETDIIFCDCPGFFDNRGDLQDIINSFAITSIFHHAHKIKIILTISDGNLQSSKGKEFIAACKLVEKLFPDANEISKFKR